jgi:hypothetical protein
MLVSAPSIFKSPLKRLPILLINHQIQKMQLKYFSITIILQ